MSVSVGADGLLWRDDSPSVWTDFLGRPQRTVDLAEGREAVGGRCVLLTGAGGSIGSELAFTIAQLQPRRLVLLDCSELGLHQLSLDLKRLRLDAPVRISIGSVNDTPLLRELFLQHRPEIVIHAAAYKHVPLMEANPFAAAATNVLGTKAIIDQGEASGAEQCILLSTDKAVDPRSLMGATKRIAELILLTRQGQTKMKVLRLGNVLGSSGSVVPLFLSQIADGGPVTVTHPEASRYFLTVRETVSYLLGMTSVRTEPGLFVPTAGEPRRIVSLAKFLVAHAKAESGNTKIVFSGLRPGDKLTEQMTAGVEVLGAVMRSGLQRVETAAPIARTIDQSVEAIAAAVSGRDLGMLLEGIVAAVPEYRASEVLFPRMTGRGSA